MSGRPPLSQSLVYGILTAYSAAIVFLFLIWLRAGSDDEVARMGFAGSVLDPFVLTVLIPVGLITGLAAGGVTHFAVSGRRYRNAILTVASAAIGWIIIATLVSPGVALAGVLPVFGLSLLAVRFTPWTQESD